MKKDNPMIKKNTTKEKLRAGQPVIGCRMDFESPYIVETIGNAGFDFVYSQPLKAEPKIELVLNTQAVGIEGEKKAPSF